MKSYLLSGILGLFYFTGAFAQDQTPTSSLAPMLKKVMPAVVNISVQGDIPANMLTPAPNPQRGNPSPEQTPQPQPNQPRKFQSLGSGVIVDASEGYVITNAHVVREAKIITVTLIDGRRLQAKLLGADPGTDIAVLKIEAHNLTSVPISDSNKLLVGDYVVAIGNPFGLNTSGSSQTATFGIVSALNRSELNIDGVENFIQTDAAINPGNSGGALVKSNGDLVGINTAIITPMGGNIGIGFAIPANMMRDVMQQIIKYGSVHRGLMGIYVQHLTPELALAFNLPETTKGAIVTQVNANSPASAAGLQSGDIIQSINDRLVTEANQVKSITGLLRVGSTVSMKVLRNGKQVQINAVVEDAKTNVEKMQKADPFLFGLALMTLNEVVPGHGQILGVQVSGASEDSPGWRSGLRPGDVIIEANGKRVNNLESLKAVVANTKDQLLLHVLQGTGSLFLIIKP